MRVSWLPLRAGDQRPMFAGRVEPRGACGLWRRRSRACRRGAVDATCSIMLCFRANETRRHLPRSRLERQSVARVVLSCCESMDCDAHSASEASRLNPREGEESRQPLAWDRPPASHGEFRQHLSVSLGHGAHSGSGGCWFDPRSERRHLSPALLRAFVIVSRVAPS